MADIVEESVTYGSMIRKGAEQSMREVALKMLEEVIPLDAIARVTKISINQFS
jgi:transposase-like protein